MATKKTEKPVEPISRDARLKQAQDLQAQADALRKSVKDEIKKEEDEKLAKWQAECLANIDLLFSVATCNKQCDRGYYYECPRCLLQEAKLARDNGGHFEWPRNVQVEINVRYVEPQLDDDIR